MHGMQLIGTDKMAGQSNSLLVKEGFARDTHASRGKDVHNSSVQVRVCMTAHSPLVQGEAVRGTGIACRKPCMQKARVLERSTSWMTTETMDNCTNNEGAHGTLVCHSLPVVPSMALQAIASQSSGSHALLMDPACHNSSYTKDSYRQEFLVKNGWRIDTDHNVLICLQCTHILNPVKVWEHVMDSHREVQPDHSLQNQLKEACGLQYPLLTFTPAHPLHPVPVIAGLKIQENMQICSACKWGYGCDKGGDASQASRLFRKHVCKKGEDNPEQEFVILLAQRFGQNFSWFAVIMGNVTPPGRTDIWDEYQSRKALGVPCGIVPSIPDDYRVLNQFLQKECWLEHVKGLDASVAAELCLCSVKHVVFGSLPHRVHAFLAKYQGKTNSYFLQQLIGTRPSSEHAKNFPHHHRVVHFDAH
jgi:hypothetical protein